MSKLREAVKSPRGTDWTPERLARLKRLWLDGWSAKTIAAELGGITRNAVLGKLHRLRLKRGLKPSAGPPRPKPPPPIPIRGPTGPKPSYRWVAPKPNTPGRSGTARKAPGIPVAPPAAPTGIERGRRVEAAAARQGAEPVARPTITIDDLNGNTCRFITTDRSPFLYCGEATFAGTPYCKEHALRCYQIGRRAA